jgi:DNA-binding transcriptional MerR regulator
VNVETLRYYERRGLLPAPEREPSGHRRYDEETVRFLRAIKEAQAVGFTLAEIAEYLQAAGRSGSPSEALRVRMARKIDEIDARVAALQRMREELVRVVGCACASLDHCTCGAAWLARRGRKPQTRPPLLHITNGESAGNTLRQTALGGAVLPWQDALHEGPVPAAPRPELLRARAGFLSECGWGGRHAILSSLEGRDRQFVDALRDGLQVVLWFEHDLYDQLQLLDTLALAAAAGAAPELIVGSFPGKPRFAGLGELTTDELEALWPPRRETTPAALAAAADGWAPSAHPSRPDWPSGRRAESTSCPSLLRRYGDCSRSCPPRPTGCPEPSGAHSKPSRTALAHLRPRSSRLNASRKRRSSATPGSTERSRRSGPAPSGSSKPPTGSRFRPPLRSATHSCSRDSHCD